MLQVFDEADADCSSVHEAVARSHSGCLQSLLQQPTHAAAAVLRHDDDQHTTLHVVQHFTAYCTEITAAILDSLTQQQQLTAVINRTDSSGNTALRRTVVKRGDCTHVCHGCMGILMLAGADIIADEWKPDILAEVLSESTLCDDSPIDVERTVQALVQRGLDVEQRNSDGLTRLQQLAQSISKGCLSAARVEAVVAAMRALLANDADALETDGSYDCFTALHMLLAKSNYTDDYDRLLRGNEHWSYSREPAIRALYDSAGAECLEAKGRTGETPLHLAVQWPGYVQLLLSLGADVDARAGCERTPLHDAAEQGAVQSVQLLLDAGADINAVTMYEGQPLHMAAQSCELQVCRLLLDRGADVNAIVEEADSFDESMLDMSVTMCALQYSDSAKDRWLEPTLRCVQLLVEAGADVQQYSEKHGTLLHSSATNKCTAVTQYLLGKLLPQHSDVLNRVNAQGQTALYCAAACDNAAVVKLLLTSGASVHVDNSPLLHTCFASNSADAAATLAMFNMLLDAGVSIMQLDSSG
jgi:ankyrin repeat protein